MLNEATNNESSELDLLAADLDSVDSLFGDLDDEITAAEVDDTNDDTSIEDLAAEAPEEDTVDDDLLDELAGLDDDEELSALEDDTHLEDDAAEMLDAACEVDAIASVEEDQPAKETAKAAGESKSRNRPSATLARTSATKVDDLELHMSFDDIELPPTLTRAVGNESGTNALAHLVIARDPSLLGSDIVKATRSKVVDMVLLPKKVQEKAANIVESLSMGAKISPYTQIALDMLKDGPITRKQLVEKYQEAGYSAGTAGAQASQMMKLLPWANLASGGATAMTSDEHGAIKFF